MDYLKTLKIGDPLVSLVRKPQGEEPKKKMGFFESPIKTPSIQPGSGNFTRNELSIYIEQNERNYLENYIKAKNRALAEAVPILEREERKQAVKTGMMDEILRQALRTGMIRDIEKLVRSAGTSERKAEHTAEILKRYEHLPADKVREVFQELNQSARDDEARGGTMGSLQTETLPIIARQPVSEVQKPRANMGGFLAELKGRISRMGESESKEEEEDLPRRPRGGAFRRIEEDEPMGRLPMSASMESRTSSSMTTDPVRLLEMGLRLQTLRRNLPEILSPDDMEILEKNPGARFQLRQLYSQKEKPIPKGLEVQPRGRRPAPPPPTSRKPQAPKTKKP